MANYADSDIRKWNYDLHTAIKHRILIHYLHPWINILGRWNKNLAYVDGFAGRGRYANGEPGSPLLVLDAIVERAKHHIDEHFVCHFVEADRQNFENLQAEVAAHPAMEYGRITIHLYHSTFSAASGAIIADIRGQKQPSFFFVDPFGYDDPSMATLGQILALPRAEVFVNLMFSFANRAIGRRDNPKLDVVLDMLFGTPAWRPIMDLHDLERERAFSGLYREQLRGQGAAHVLPFRMGDDTARRTLYYLVHGTQHPMGGMLMKDVMIGLATPGELGYGGATRHMTLPLFNMQREELGDFLHRRFAGRAIGFDAMMVDTLEHEETSTSRTKDYRAAIRRLEKRGAVTIMQVSTQKGLDGDDEITFSSHRQSSLFGM